MARFHETILAGFLAMVLAVLPGRAHAASSGTSVTYVNGTQRTLHVYVLTSETTFRCELMEYAGTIQPGGHWTLPVRLGSGAWVRVFAGTAGDSCAPTGALVEDRVLGGQIARSVVTIGGRRGD